MLKEKRGFTLIELLAVIVILGVLLAIAVPAVTKYINTSKKNTYVETAQQYVDALRRDALMGTYQFPVSSNQATVVTFSVLQPALEKGGKTSPYGGTFNLENSFVVIVNESTAENPKYVYYVAALDSKGYGIGTITDGNASSSIIDYNNLAADNIVQLSTGAKFEAVTGTTPGKVTINSKVITVTNSYKN